MDKIRQLRDKAREWTDKNPLKTLSLVFAVAAILTVVAVTTIRGHEQTAAPPMVTVTTPGQGLTAPTVQQAAQAAGKHVTQADSRDLSGLASRATPTATWYAPTAAISDKKASELAKQDKADFVIKNTTEPQEIGGATVYNNNYYSIKQERKHDVKVGAVVADSTAYATVTYRNRQVEYTAGYAPQTGKVMAGVSVRVAQW